MGCAETNRYQLQMLERTDGTIEFSHPELSGGQALALGCVLIRMQTDNEPPEKIKTLLRVTIKLCAWMKHAPASEIAELEKELHLRFLKECTPEQVVEAAWFAESIKRLVEGGAQ